jgi:hypothetical protein
VFSGCVRIYGVYTYSGGSPGIIVICKWNGWFPGSWSWCYGGGFIGGSKVLRFEGEVLEVRGFVIEVFSTGSRYRGLSQVDRWSFWWVIEGVRPCNGTVKWRLL